MKHDFINIDGTDYRVEYNMVAIENFMEEEPGLNTLDQLDVLAKLSPKQFRKLTWYAVAEGCDMEQIKFPFTEKEFTRKLSLGSLSKLIMVYAAHTNPETSAGAVVKKKRNKLLSR